MSDADHRPEVGDSGPAATYKNGSDTTVAAIADALTVALRHAAEPGPKQAGWVNVATILDTAHAYAKALSQ